jgi:uncharacterized membrane protein YhaH (DUF805 family)
MEWMLLPLKRYAQFSGRSPRREFWMWIVFLVVVLIVLSVLDSLFGLGGRTQFGPSAVQTPTMSGYGYGVGVTGGILAKLFLLAVLIPNLAVSVRRLHDTDRSGWWVLLPLAPYFIGIIAIFTHLFILTAILMLASLIGSILLLVWYCSHGTRGPNRFGPDPYGNVSDLEETFR